VPGSTWAPVFRFAAAGMVVILLLGLAGVRVLQTTARHEAIREARNATTAAARAVQPDLTVGVIAGDPTAVDRLDEDVRSRVLGEAVVRVKVWTAQGRIVYSDERRLIGSTYPLDAGERKALDGEGVVAELSDLSKPENRFENKDHELVEVYRAVEARDGTPLLFETYQPNSAIAASGRRVWLAFLPAMGGALGLLWLAQIPLAWSLVRRLRRSQAEREALLRKAVDASVRERARIARDLHDGVVQRLVGVSYGLGAAAARLRDDASPQLTEALATASGETRQAIRELRTLLVDISPPNLHTQGLAAALRDLLTPLSAKGITTSLAMADEPELPREVEAVLFRSAQEALRNVQSHADASHVHVDVALDGVGGATLVVQDDGRGFSGDSRPGHFGLTMLAELAHESGGRLDIDSEVGRGTRVSVEVPVA
jgi:two-component system, NarL family, sensor kinase